MYCLEWNDKAPEGNFRLGLMSYHVCTAVRQAFIRLRFYVYIYSLWCNKCQEQMPTLEYDSFLSALDVLTLLRY